MNLFNKPINYSKKIKLIGKLLKILFIEEKKNKVH